ncbi:hypothetical protein C900_05792 [Fulvivirga imtechensis AK7]|uniref:AB hydrolase-1 domain-containing protein n=1 Tax=Fulvivirga imtechensis AK7 TaxID=1237149 RepID=L8JMS2_9BACT|nr:alpha/beta fold hydrolase [Fulvivirga imtechensis]ELR68779.1 hypothetical protein C900_05792 [Fulvivirga imtechensis AK7]
MIQEEIVNFGEGGILAGVFTPMEKNASCQRQCIILLNAGMIHKIGPNRIYKKQAEALSKMGYSCFRFDFSGIGDSGFSNSEIGSTSRQICEVVMAMNWLQENKGLNQFILSGICSGADIAWRTSLEDERVRGLCLIDGIYSNDVILNNIWAIANRNLKIRYYKKHMFSLTRWTKLLSGKSGLFNIRNLVMVWQFFSRAVRKIVLSRRDKQHNSELNEEVVINDNMASDINLWNHIFNRGVKVQLIFCEGGNAIDVYKLTLADHLKRYEANTMLHRIFVKDVDHTFTPVWSQHRLIHLISIWLKEEFKEEDLIEKKAGAVA